MQGNIKKGAEKEKFWLKQQIKVENGKMCYFYTPVFFPFSGKADESLNI